MLAVQDGVCKSREEWIFDRWKQSVNELGRRGIEAEYGLKEETKLEVLMAELDSIEKELPNGLKRLADSFAYALARLGFISSRYSISANVPRCPGSNRIHWLYRPSRASFSFQASPTSRLNFYTKHHFTSIAYLRREVSTGIAGVHRDRLSLESLMILSVTILQPSSVQHRL